MSKQRQRSWHWMQFNNICTYISKYEMSSFLCPTGLTFIYKFSSQIVCFTYVFCQKIERYKFCNRMLMHLFGRVNSPIAKHLRNNRVIIFIIHWIVIAWETKSVWSLFNTLIILNVALIYEIVRTALCSFKWCLSNYIMMYSILYWIWLEFDKFCCMVENLTFFPLVATCDSTVFLWIIWFRRIG